jgi:hypothetical protein
MGRNEGTVNVPRIVFGLVILALGVLLTLDKLGWIEVASIGRLWPVFLVLIGLSRFLQPAGEPGRGFGAILIFVGGWWLLYNLGWTELWLWDYWPLIFVAIGLSILWRAVRQRGGGSPDWACRECSPAAGLPGLETPVVEPKVDGVQAVDQVAPPTGLDTDRYVRAAALLGGVKRRNVSRDFRGGDATAVLGGCEIDLREAKIASGEAVLDVFALWGGVEVRVPPDWAVVLRGMPVLGAIEDQTTAAGVPKRATLVIKGVAIMGGVGVKN